ncbi:MAG: hypothetical protein ACJ8DZ_13975 [Allosphingosinicella sp.]
MRTIALLALLGLTACADANRDAQERYDMVRERGTPADICRAARDAADIALRHRDRDNFWAWSMRADTDCLNARLQPDREPVIG